MNNFFFFYNNCIVLLDWLFLGKLSDDNILSYGIKIGQ